MENSENYTLLYARRLVIIVEVEQEYYIKNFPKVVEIGQQRKWCRRTIIKTVYEDVKCRRRMSPTRLYK